MVRALIQRLLGRTAGHVESHAADLESLIVELALRLDDELRAALQGEFAAARAGAWRDRLNATATLFCRVEDRLAERAEDPRAFRAQFRSRAAQQWPRLAVSDELRLVFAPPEAQEEAVCHSFLTAAIDAAHATLGSAGGDRLGAMRRWLQTGGPPPLVDAPPDDLADPLLAIQHGSRAFHAWLDQVLGRRADGIYEDAYRRTAARFGAVDGFPAVLGMLPERLLTADKLSLLRRSHIERILREKVAELERANDDIRRARDTLEDRVRERTAQLELAREEAVAANRAKSDFLAMVSHELRTPLNAILGFSQIMLDAKYQALLGDRYVEYARHIYDSGAHLLDIINAILDTAKLEAGKYELNEEEVALDEVVDQCLTTTRPRLQHAALTASKRIDADVPLLVVDRRMLVQMLLNLISNAIKFTPAGGTIRIDGVLNEHGGVDVGVHDSGIGMAEEDIPLALAPFQQVRSAYIRNESGTGLGLPLVINMSRLHGGEFILRSKPGAGTSAIIRLPAARLRRA